MSSWWLVGGLALGVLGYLVFAFVPMGSRYLWQQRGLDLAQVQVLRWAPLHVVMLLLAVTVLWATLRRVAWRPRNLGAFVAALGLSAAIFGFSLSLRFGLYGIVLVPPSGDEGLVLTTNYADPVDRVLVVQFGPNPPLSIPLDRVPRWNDVPPDAEGRGPLDIALHASAELSQQLDYRVRLTAVGYLAAGEVQDGDDGSTSVVVASSGSRGNDGKLLPHRAVLALRIDSEDEQGRAASMLVWLPFEPTGAERLMPTQRYEVPGFGSLGLAFRPVARDLPFALGVSVPTPSKTATLHLSETNPATNRMMPMIEKRGMWVGAGWTHEPIAARPGMERIHIELSSLPNNPTDGDTAMLRVLTRPGRLIIVVGGWVFVGGMGLWALSRLVLRRKV